MRGRRVCRLAKFMRPFAIVTGVLWASPHRIGVIRIVPGDDPPSTTPVSSSAASASAGEPQPISALGSRSCGTSSCRWNRNSLEVDFVSPGFGPDDGVRYQIKLEGGDPDWSSPSRSSARSAYANLAPGRYRFLARAINADGLGERRCRQHRVQDPAADLGSVVVQGLQPLLLISGLAYGFYRYRVSRAPRGRRPCGHASPPTCTTISAPT